MMMDSKSELLLRKARQYDQNALAEIYDLYSDALFAYAFKHVGKSQVAEDLVAETFSRFLKALERGGGPKEYLRAYLYRITHNLIIDSYRREPPPPLELEEELLSEEGADPKSIVADLEDADRVRNALRLITPEQSQVITLRFLEGWSGPEIAQAMNNTLGSIKALQHRGLAALQRILLENDQPQESK
jgi:RNA polymerase sigma-70 factor (ECF subfamily)